MQTKEFYTRIARRFAPQGQITRCTNEWYEVARQRSERRRFSDPLPATHGKFAHMAIERRRQVFVDEIARRGFDTVITSGSGAWRDAEDLELSVYDRQDGLWLLGAEGWRKYTRKYSAFATLRYLCGIDDNGPWAVRVPGSCTTVEEALDYTIPAEVKRAHQTGRRVLRQGDVFAIEMRRDGKHELPRGHRFDVATRTLTHEGGHETVMVPFPCKFITAQGLAPRRAYSRIRWFD